VLLVLLFRSKFFFFFVFFAVFFVLFLFIFVYFCFFCVKNVAFFLVRSSQKK